MKQSIIVRIKELERRQRPEPMIIIAEDPDGGLHEMSVREAFDRGFGFVRVKHGGNMKDLDKILGSMTEDAYKEEL